MNQLEFLAAALRRAVAEGAGMEPWEVEGLAELLEGIVADFREAGVK